MRLPLVENGKAPRSVREAVSHPRKGELLESFVPHLLNSCAMPDFMTQDTLETIATLVRDLNLATSELQSALDTLQALDAKAQNSVTPQALSFCRTGAGVGRTNFSHPPAAATLHHRRCSQRSRTRAFAFRPHHRDAQRVRHSGAGAARSTHRSSTRINHEIGACPFNPANVTQFADTSRCVESPGTLKT